MNLWTGNGPKICGDYAERKLYNDEMGSIKFSQHFPQYQPVSAT